MALPPQKFREILFLMIYSSDYGTASFEETASMIMKELKVTKSALTQAKEKVDLIVQKMDEIDKMIEEASTGYSFDRISQVEKAILRLSLFELIFDQDKEPKIVISEAIRLTRKFGTFESARFVNAIMDAIYQNGLKRSNEPSLT